MKKIISIGLTVLLVLAMCSCVVYATADATAEVSQVEALPGDKVEVFFSLDCPDGIKTLSFLDFVYDDTVLTVVESECTWLADGMLKDIDFENNASIITFTKNTVLSGAVLKFVFVVSENAESGTLPISCSVLGTRMIDNVETRINIAVSDGAIIIGDAEKPKSDFEYEIKNGSVVITGYNGTAKALEIRETAEIDGIVYDVAGIAEYAFEGNEEITSVTIPESVKIVGEGAFYDCTSLTAVTVYGRDTKIGEVAFGYYRIDRKTDGVTKGFTVYGYEGSTAEEYADSDPEITFVALAEKPLVCVHDYVGAETLKATCKNTGMMTYTCSACGEAYTQEIPVDAEKHVGATEIRNAKEESCSDAGYTGDTYCTDCDTKLAEGKEIPATGNHTFGEWVIVKVPTVSENGTEERKCTVCGKKESRTIGNIAYIPGDVNGDGNVKAADARIILRVSAKLEQLSDEKFMIADINSDGNVNASDARIALRISAKLDSADNYIK